MKNNLLIVVLIFLISQAVATSERKLSDLMFMPEASQFQIETNVSASSGRYDENITSPASSKSFSKYKTSLFLWENVFSYGVTSFFTLGVGVSYQLKNETENTSGTNSSGRAYSSNELDAKTNNPGFENIKLGSRFRVMNESFLVDGVIQGTLSTAPDKKSQSYSSGTTQVSNDGNASSASLLKVGIDVGKKNSSFQWKGSAFVIHGFKHDLVVLNADSTETPALDVNIQEKPFTDFMLIAGFGFQLTSALSLDSNIEGTLIEKREKDLRYKDGTTANVEETSRTDVSFTANTRYEFSKTVMGSFSARYKIGGSHDWLHSEPPDLQLKGTVSQIQEVRLGVGFDVLF